MKGRVRRVFLLITVAFLLLVALRLIGSFRLHNLLAAKINAEGGDGDQHSNNPSRVNENPAHLFGFFYQCHREPKATLHLIQTLHQQMPNAPVWMVSGGDGFHYDPLAKRFSQIHYQHEDVNINIKRGKDNPDLRLWFRRIHDAAVWCDCQYLVLLEDDVKIDAPLKDAPKHDLGGVTAHLWNKGWYEKLKKNFGASNWTYDNYGMCGGSYVSTLAFLAMYQKLEATKWKRFYELSSPKGDPRIARWNDAALAALMMDDGYSMKPWTEGLRQNKQPGQNASAPLMHMWKDLYGKPLNKRADGWVTLEQKKASRLRNRFG